AKANAGTPRDKRTCYDVNREATRQELRSYVCGQCHVEYYFKKTEGNLLVYPWAKGLRVDDIESYYDDPKAPFYDWPHKETGAKTRKAQQRGFEMGNGGPVAGGGVAGAASHMPEKREGADEIGDQPAPAPLLNTARGCEGCHRHSETELMARAELIQGRT